MEVEVPAAVEGDGEGAAEADHGGGLWEGREGIRAGYRPEYPLTPAPPPLQGEAEENGSERVHRSRPAAGPCATPTLAGKFSHKEPMKTALQTSNTSWFSFICNCVNIGDFSR